MGSQRQRFTEQQVLDQQSRRALHDEILPALHAAMLSLSAQPRMGSLVVAQKPGEGTTAILFLPADRIGEG
jgi:hypothetical protein